MPKKPTIIKIGNYSPSCHNASVIIDVGGIAPTVMENHGTVTAIQEPIIYGWSRNNDGTVKNWHPVNVANCVTSAKRDNTQNYVKETGGRIRKLTPLEYFRLMGVSDCDYNKMVNAGIKKTQLLKLAGNSIVVDVLFHIMRTMFVDTEEKNKQLTLF